MYQIAIVWYALEGFLIEEERSSPLFDEKLRHVAFSNPAH